MWKQRLEASNMSDKKSWNLPSYLGIYLISCNWSFCSAILAQWQRMPVKAIVSQLVKFFCQSRYDLSSKVGAPITGDYRKHILTMSSPLWDINPEARKGFFLSNESEFVRELGKAKWPSWISHSPNYLVYSHCLSILSSLMRG